METTLLKIGDGIANALGVSDKAMVTLTFLMFLWFYFQRWKPFVETLNEHIQASDNSEKTNIERVKEHQDTILSMYDVVEDIKDRMIKYEESNNNDHSEDRSRAELLLNECKKLQEKLDRQEKIVDKINNKTNAEQYKKIADDLDYLKIELTKIVTRLSISPNARDLK